MAVTLTASNSLTIQHEIKRMFSEDTAAGRQYADPVATAAKVISSQGAKAMPRFNDAGVCVGYKIYWPDLADIAAQTTYSSTTADSSADCDIAYTAGVGTQSTTYTNNLFIDQGFMIDDNDCANDFKYAQKFAEGMKHVMTEIRFALNTRAINFLNTNASANLASDELMGQYNFEVSGTTTTIQSSAWADQSILMKLQILAQANRLPNNFLILDSSNLLLQKELAAYLALNDNQRSEGALYGNIRARYASDLLNMSNTTSALTTYLANPNMIAFWNNSAYSEMARVISAKDGLSAMSVEDPMLMYRYINTSADGTVISDSMVPVKYDVLVKTGCEGRDANGRPYVGTKVEVKLIGGLHLGPVGDNSETQILKLVNPGGA